MRVEQKLLAGCCGLDCGLCPRFQSKAASRCLGCHLGPQHDYCSVYRCCATKRGYHTCAECDEYPCDRLIRVLGVEEGLDSFISHKPAMPNLKRIRENGFGAYLEEQKERRLLLEHLLVNHNEGHSMSFYCRACALMRPELVREAISGIEEETGSAGAESSDLKARAKAMRTRLQKLADDAGTDLKLRQKKGS